MRPFLIGFMVFLQAGCQVMGLVACDGPGRPALVAVVDDAATGTAIRDGTIFVRVQSGSYADSISFNADGETQRFPMASERWGRFDLTVGATGYVTREMRDIVVKKDRCDQPRTRDVEVSLQPSSALP